MALGQSIRNAIGVAWRGVLSAVTRGQDAFQTVSQAVGRIGLGEAPAALTDPQTVGLLNSMANSWVAAENAFTNAAMTDPITASMVTLAPWSMDLNAYNAMPGHHIVVGLNVEGQPETQYRTITGVGPLGMTKGELIDFLDVQAQALSVGTTPGGGTGGTVLGIKSVTITVGPALG